MTTELVEFHFPFRLAVHSAPLPAGCYRVDTAEEMMEGLSFPPWRRTGMTISQDGPASGRSMTACSITPAELAAALAADAGVRP